MIGSTSKFRVHDVVYNKGSFAIARGYWDGNNSQLRLACRWHDDDGLGYPQTFGKPQWMQLPDDIQVEIVQTLDPTASSVKVRFV